VSVQIANQCVSVILTLYLVGDRLSLSKYLILTRKEARKNEIHLGIQQMCFERAS
jgi:hypothetical protein